MSSASSVSDGEAGIRPSLSRRSSRPSSLRIERTSVDWTPDISVLDEKSPDIHRGGPAINGKVRKDAESPGVTRSQLTPQPHPRPAGQAQPNMQQQQPSSPRRVDPAAALHSPCFVHSHLDKGVSFADWLRSRQSMNDVGVAKSLGGPSPVEQNKLFPVDLNLPTPNGTSSSTPSDYDEEEAGSLTRQLAETAVGVREMSKQLGKQLLGFFRCISLINFALKVVHASARIFKTC